MVKNELPLPVNQLALLQAYLYEIFGKGKVCEKNYKYTQWYLKENYPRQDTEQIIDQLKKHELNCDCDILRKLDLQRIYTEGINFHE